MSIPAKPPFVFNEFALASDMQYSHVLAHEHRHFNEPGAVTRMSLLPAVPLIAEAARQWGQTDDIVRRTAA